MCMERKILDEIREEESSSGKKVVMYVIPTERFDKLYQEITSEDECIVFSSSKIPERNVTLIDPDTQKWYTIVDEGHTCPDCLKGICEEAN